jgi:hypothetical protein
MLSSEGSPIAFFGTGENHNTPRTTSREGGSGFARFAFAFSALIPSLPFIHSGAELFETLPVNTGLGFTLEDIENFPSSRLPLFSACAMNWDASSNMSELIEKVLSVRARNFIQGENFLPKTTILIGTNDERIVAFERAFSNGKRVLFVGSMTEETLRAEIRLDTQQDKIIDLISGKEFVILDSVLATELGSWEFIVAEIK